MVAKCLEIQILISVHLTGPLSFGLLGIIKSLFPYLLSVRVASDERFSLWDTIRAIEDQYLINTVLEI